MKYKTLSLTAFAILLMAQTAIAQQSSFPTYGEGFDNSAGQNKQRADRESLRRDYLGDKLGFIDDMISSYKTADSTLTPTITAKRAEEVQQVTAAWDAKIAAENRLNAHRNANANGFSRSPDEIKALKEAEETRHAEALANLNTAKDAALTALNDKYDNYNTQKSNTRSIQSDNRAIRRGSLDGQFRKY